MTQRPEMIGKHLAKMVLLAAVETQKTKRTGSTPALPCQTGRLNPNPVARRWYLPLLTYVEEAAKTPRSSLPAALCRDLSGHQFAFPRNVHLQRLMASMMVSRKSQHSGQPEVWQTQRKHLLFFAYSNESPRSL